MKRHKETISMQGTFLIIITSLIFSITVNAQAKEPVKVCDFEWGITGWRALDAPKHEGHSKAITLLSIVPSSDAHSGSGSMRIDFHSGQGWANTWLDLSHTSMLWAKNRVDEITFWMKGDGSDKQVRAVLQQLADDLTTPVFYEVPVSLKETDWHQVRIPLSRFQNANPTYPLRLPALTAFQINGSGEIGPAHLLIDDIEARNANGEGGRYVKGPLDEKLAKIPPVTALPRLGNWIWPGKNQEKLEKCLGFGIQFSSWGESILTQQWMFMNGIATNYSIGRPSGAELIAGLGLTDEDMDQDSQGCRTGEGIQSAVFHPAIPDRFADYVKSRVRPIADAPWVSSFVVSSPISMYGEVHYAASTAHQYAVFSRPAKENFRNWLKEQYNNDLQAISKAWGQPYNSWEEILPPDGPKAGPEGIDIRRSWSDFMHWYNAWLDEVTLKSIEAARSETKKPIAAMIGGPKVGYGQGIALGNVGPVVKMLGYNKPAFFNDTDGQTLFSTRYTRAACSQYGVELMIEHVGPPGLDAYLQYNTLHNILACGGDHVHLAHLGELFDEKHFFSRIWKDLAPLALRYRTSPPRSDAAYFHSYRTSWYRPNRWNPDGVRLYDKTNTLWTPEREYPSWGRALGSPDVVDDTMIEDGALKGRKLLVIPNSSVTVTTRKAVEAICKWVRAGGTLIGFGPGCLAYTIEADRSLSATPNMAGLVPSVTAESGMQNPRVEDRVGKGRAILYLTPADPDYNSLFVQEMMPVLEQEAEKAGVHVWCRADPEHQVNVLYCGRNISDGGKHIFAADFMRYVRSGLPDAIYQTDSVYEFTFDPSLKGEAELVGITDAFEQCAGGKADYNPESHILIVQFTLPGKLVLTFGKGTSGLALSRHPLMLWQGNDLILRPAGGYGEKQTQKPVTVTAEGDLQPANVTMPYLIHGNLHRQEFGSGPTFRLNLNKPGSVTVHVNSVPSNVVLVMSLDGKEVLRQELPDKDGTQNPFANEYNQDFTIDVPAGEHTVKIDNLGDDWMCVDRYVFRGFK